KTFRNFIFFKGQVTSGFFQDRWRKEAGKVFEGVNLADAAAVKQSVGIPVICTGGFQTASFIRGALTDGKVDAVSIARSLVANPDLVKQFAAGLDRPEKPCTYCNKCLVNVIENPLGCYEPARFSSREEMVRTIMSVFDPPPFA
ncbi:MAG: tRNA-dihydrouridine synthase, partial [Bryobacteraceae bacterium]